MAQVEHPGSMLRGGFGHALKSLACSCPGEDHLPDCLYQRLFEPPPPPSGPDRFRDPPPAFVITPPPVGQDNRGGFKFWMTLIGSATGNLALILASWQLAGMNGFGPGQTRATIMLDGTEVLPRSTGAAKSLAIEFTSPLFLKRNGRALDPAQLKPEDLVASLARRIALVNAQLDPPIETPDAQSWITMARELSLRSDLSPVRFSRYSNRQGGSMPLGGVVGRVWLEGGLGAGLVDGFLLGQWLHLGGKTSLGLGGYRLHQAGLPRMNIATESHS